MTILEAFLSRVPLLRGLRKKGPASATTAPACPLCREQPGSAPGSRGDRWCETHAFDITCEGLVRLEKAGRLTADLRHVVEDILQPNPKRIDELTYRIGRDDGIIVAFCRQFAGSPAAEHERLCSRRGKVIVGKFFKERVALGGPERILEESGHEAQNVDWNETHKRIREKYLSRDLPFWLYIVEPDYPPRYWRGQVVDLVFNVPGGQSRSANEPSFALPVFDGLDAPVASLIPPYYWLNGREDSGLRFHGNFWFLVEGLVEMEPGFSLELKTFPTGRPFTAAGASYPMLVFTRDHGRAAEAEARETGEGDVPEGLAAELRKEFDKVEWLPSAAREHEQLQRPSMKAAVLQVAAALHFGKRELVRFERGVADEEGLWEAKPRHGRLLVGERRPNHGETIYTIVAVSDRHMSDRTIGKKRRQWREHRSRTRTG